MLNSTKNEEGAESPTMSKVPSTPPKKQTNILTDETPRTDRSHGGNTKVNALREQIATQMTPETVTCSSDDFISYYLDFGLKKTFIETCVTKLKDEKVLDSGLSWKAFSKAPSRSSEHESKVFDGLKDISDTLAKLSSASPVCHVYQTNPNSAHQGEIAGSNNKVDGYFCSPQSLTDGPRFLSDLAVPTEFKKSLDNASQNSLQIVASANQIMNNDPRRMFTFAMTIEDTSVSLWYFSRSHSVKSHSFDFIKEPIKFVQVFASFMFASPEMLGFDPSILRVQDGNSVAYLYTIKGQHQDRHFLTQQCISELRDLCITGRSTRVWEAVEVLSKKDHTRKNNKTVALKDVWLDATARTERQILDDIFSDLDKFAAGLGVGDEEPVHFKKFDQALKDDVRNALVDGAYKRHFLTIGCDWQGHTSKAIFPGYEVEPDIYGIAATASKSISTLSGSAPRDPSRQKSHTPVPPVSTTSPTLPLRCGAPKRTFSSKRQYRLIYEEVCSALHDSSVKSVRGAFRAMQDCLLTLTLLYCAGWVHRDISSGNVLLWMDKGDPRGKLGDFEYAKKFPSNQGSADPKTGTPYFMPVEMGSGRYLEGPPTTSFLALPKIGNEPEPPQHNFQHDLESLWWLALWMITVRVIYSPCHAKMGQVFTNSVIPSGHRIEVLSLGALRAILNHLHPEVSNLGPPLRGMQILLLSEYLKRNDAEHQKEAQTYSYIHIGMHTYFRFAVDAIPDNAPEFGYVHAPDKKRPQPENSHSDGEQETGSVKRPRRS